MGEENNLNQLPNLGNNLPNLENTGSIPPLAPLNEIITDDINNEIVYDEKGENGGSPRNEIEQNIIMEEFIKSFRLGKTTEDYFNNLNKLTKHIDPNEVVSDISENIEEWSVEWTEDDALKFASQFMIYADENDNIDYDKIDFKAYTPDYFRTLYPRFDDDVYEILADYSNKKLEDNRNNYFKIRTGNFRPFEEA